MRNLSADIQENCLNDKIASFECGSCLQSLRKVGKDSTVLLICITVFLSYLPEAGQYSSFFLYLRQVSLQTLIITVLFTSF
uniref:Uncharacterized protein n=1 Tax=Anguilla anguilla TaxID=7936 RepID=A0A0E9R953_ANGAN